MFVLLTKIYFLTSSDPLGSKAQSCPEVLEMKKKDLESKLKQEFTKIYENAFQKIGNRIVLKYSRSSTDALCKAHLFCFNAQNLFVK